MTNTYHAGVAVGTMMALFTVAASKSEWPTLGIIAVILIIYYIGEKAARWLSE